MQVTHSSIILFQLAVVNSPVNRSVQLISLFTAGLFCIQLISSKLLNR